MRTYLIQSNIQTIIEQISLYFQQGNFIASKFSSYVEVAQPSTKLYHFHGTLIDQEGRRFPISNENLLLRESRIKNTDYVEGLVLYTGHETKAMLNNGGPRYVNY